MGYTHYWYASKRQSANDQLASEIEKLRTDPAHKHLKPRGSWDGITTAAANLRAELKRAFPGVKFSVRSSSRGTSSIRVQWTDGPTRAAVERIANKYKSGDFDGMTDCYRYERSAWTEVFGSARYISCDREHSLEALKTAVREVCLENGWELFKVEVSASGHAYIPHTVDQGQHREVDDYLEQRRRYEAARELEQ